ncbi:MAG: pyrroline-5-carboxylate reductase [Tatlockia sp.]|jgi:pyrroline-5-carboxylate reductase
MNICFIGFGNMAKAIALGLQAHWSDCHLFAAAPSLSIGNTDGIRTHPDNLAHLKTASVVILAVKPEKMAATLNEIKSAIPKHCLVISVAAGINTAFLEAHCPPKQAIVRAMPNIACQTGSGACALFANPCASEEQRHLTERLFTCSGIVTWVKEEKDIDSFTALSGSGLAYVFLFLEAMIQGASQLGIERDIARTFALQTMKGALDLAKKSPLEIKALRTQVTSPGGTTEAAIVQLQKLGFEEAICTAMQAAAAKAKALGA